MRSVFRRWDAIVARSQALLNLQRVTAVVGINVPMQPCDQVPPVSVLAKVLAGKFSPWPYFQETRMAVADMGRDVSTTVRRLLAHPTSVSLGTSPDRKVSLTASLNRSDCPPRPAPMKSVAKFANSAAQDSPVA